MFLKKLISKIFSNNIINGKSYLFDKNTKLSVFVW